ncbi:hypothetical protein [Mariprofundus aestuarium]|nr:hypothetical protein [Mariprofundus aestuarium]
MPKLLWETGGGQTQQDHALEVSDTEAVKPQKVSQVAKTEYEIPMAGRVGARAGALPDKFSRMLEGRAVTLENRFYSAQPGQLFSASADAMYSLNIPVDIVDSPNGIITSDWVRAGDNNPSLVPSIVGYTRHRFLLRVLVDSGDKAGLEVRVIGQEYENSQWVDRKLKRNVSEELFAAVGEQLMRNPAGNP